MDVIEAIRARKSIRGYKPDHIPRDVLKEIMEIALRSPSTMNTQPWGITVVTGEVLDKIRQGNVEMLNSGEIPNPETPLPIFEGEYRRRQVDLAIQLFKLMDIARENKEKRTAWMERGYRFFDAPAAIILSMDKSLTTVELNLLDIGAIMQTICLVAVKYGLGTCIEDQGTMFPEVVRKYIGLPESKRIIVAIAIGYPDWEFPANRVESAREPMEDVVTWCGGG